MKAAGPSQRILIVDDEEDLREILRDAFERSGYSVTTCESGRSALNLLESESPGAYRAVLTDIRMPDGDGIFLLETIRKRHVSDPAVFLMTGYSDLTYREAIGKGALELFEKPFDITALVQTVITRLRR